MREELSLIKIDFAEQDVKAKGFDVCSEEERKMVWMRETRIKIFMQMELEACWDELDCTVNNCPEEYYPPKPLPIPSGYAKNLARRAEMAKKSILSPTFNMVKKKYYPLPVHQPQVSPQHPEFHHAHHHCRALSLSRWRRPDQE